MRRIALLLRADLRDDVRVLRPRRRCIHRRGPLLVALMRIRSLLQRYRDASIPLLRLHMHHARLGRCGHDKPREVLVQRLSSEREVLLELIRRHEER